MQRRIAVYLRALGQINTASCLDTACQTRGNAWHVNGVMPTIYSRPGPTPQAAVMHTPSHGLWRRYEVMSTDLEVLHALGLVLIAVDRPGYGASTRDPHRSFQVLAQAHMFCSSAHTNRSLQNVNLIQCLVCWSMESGTTCIATCLGCGRKVGRSSFRV